jgi:2-dehydro-3-deoxygluconokinase
MAEVVTLGECMAVLYPPEPVALDQAPTLLLDIGGAESNLAIRLQRLGHTARFISRVGDDPFGHRIVQTLAESRVDSAFITVDAIAPTGVFFREWLPDGTRRVYYYRAGSAASRLSPTDLRLEAFQGARIVHLTGITPALSPGCAAAVARAIELARAVGAQVSFDPNYRPRLWDEATARATLLPLIAQADILLMGHEDSLAIFGTDDADAAMGQALALGAHLIVFKQAERGASALTGARSAHVPAHPVEQVIDPVGAGDAFDAGFLAGLLRGYELEQALQLGARLGAAAVGALGDYAG